MEHLTDKPYSRCVDGNELTEVNFDKNSLTYTLSIEPESQKYETNIVCDYAEILRKTEDEIEYGEPVTFYDKIDIPTTVDQVYVRCYSNDETIYKNTHAFVQDKRIPGTTEEEYVSILIIGIDSMSRSSFIRTMPKSWSYLESNERWYDFPGYNRAGYATYANLVPLLAGLVANSDDYPCRSNDVGGLDECPFIWKEFEKHGYVTAFAEDTTAISTFNYLKKGFENPPTDHYLRPFLQSTGKIFQASGLCLGYKHTAEHVYDYMMDFAEMYSGSPYFGVFWTNTFSHDNPEWAFQMDERMRTYFEDLEHILDETIVILVSDHGSRFGPARQTKIGSIEENLPFLRISFPPSILTEEVKKAVEINRARLISPFDIHKTLLDLIGEDTSIEGCEYCQSILKPISPERNCDDAGIPKWYCSCNEFTDLEIDSDLVIYTSVKIVEYINHLKNSYKKGNFKSKCRDLSLGEIKDARLYEYNNSSSHIFVTFTTKPNEGWFEVMVLYLNGQIVPNIYDETVHITRSNSYWADSSCIKELALLSICSCYN
ncbi:hypothetical protein ACFFRR_003721 [Megaselia abdita]